MLRIVIFAVYLAEIFKLSQILFIVLNKTVRCQIEEYVTRRIMRFIAMSILKIIVTSLKRKMMY